MKIKIPENAKKIIKILEDNGFEAYVVGGYVRDYLLGRKADDYDITTNATPDVIKNLFKKSIDTGIKHGTVTVLMKEGSKIKPVEVTTFRIDGEYIDSRHPESVTFVKNINEDLARRDFTINAMAYNDKSGLIDLYEGEKDLKRRIVRAVGDPLVRFDEDALRMLRAIRFASKLNFNIDINTHNAIKKLAPTLSNISKERIQVELIKILSGENPTYLQLAFETGLAKYIAKDFEKINTETFLDAINRYKYKLENHKLYAMLLYGSEDNYKSILKELKLDNKTIQFVSNIIEIKKIYKSEIEIKIKEFPVDYITYKIKKILEKYGYDNFYEFLYIYSAYEKRVTTHILEIIDYLKKKKTPITIDDLKIKGEDLIKIGFNGREIGLALRELLDIVHKDRNYNTKDKLINIAKSVYNIVYDRLQ